jgi:hypothetical protein
MSDIAKETTFTRHLYDDELDTILAIAKNEQTGRVTPFEIRELVRVYSLVPELYEALNRALAAWGLEKSEPGMNLMEIEKQMRAALARARGKDRSHEGK